MKTESLLSVLLEHQDETYRQMQQRLLPNLKPETILGVRTPVLRNLARELEDGAAFCQKLPHAFFEENQIHSFLLEREKDFESVVLQVEQFLPYVDNWATCDQLRPKAFGRNREKLLPYIHRWIASGEAYSVRFGIGMLMVHYLDDVFDAAFLEEVASVQSEEYYVKMMIAWYFATALAKQYDAALPFLTEYRLDKWTHNKAIQKALESYRVLPQHKETLVQYRRR